MTNETQQLINAALPTSQSGYVSLMVYRNRAGRLEYRARFIRTNEIIASSGTHLSAGDAINTCIRNAERRLASA